MSDTVDDELLGGEDELDDVYDITQEREDVLLREDGDDYAKGRDRDFYRKKQSTDAESDDLDDDVLKLDFEEDFQDEDKLLYEDEEEEEEEPPMKKDIKITMENKQVAKPVVQVPPKTITLDKRPGSGMKKPETEMEKGDDFKKTVMKSNIRRKRGNGRGNFQGRPHFGNNNMSRRRNGTVLINPRYEGTVHVNENNARLKWDNAQFPPQNNFVPPWDGGNMVTNCGVDLQNQLLNVVSGIANRLVQAPANMLIPPPLMQNFYEGSGTNNYEQPLAFEPPPNIAEDRQPQHAYGGAQNQHMAQWANSYDVPNQVSNQMLVPAHSSFSRENQHQSYNHQMPADRRVGDPQTYNSYNTNYNDYDNSNNVQHNTGPRKPLNRTNSYENKNSYRYENNGRSYNNNNNSNYPGQNNFQNTNVNYTNDDYQARNANYSDYNTNQGNYSNNKFNYKSNHSDANLGNQNVNSYKQGNQNFNYKQQDSQQNQGNKFARNNQNNFPQQNQFRNNLNKSSTFVQQQDNASVPNISYNKPGNRRVAVDAGVGAENVAEKKARFNQDGNFKRDNQKEEKVEGKPIESTKQSAVGKESKESEDEETRQYLLKIEEQKREREKILALKEERRKQMMAEKRQEKLLEKLPEVEIKKPIQPKLKVPKQQPALFTRKHKFEQSAGTVPVQTANMHDSAQNPMFVQTRNQFPTPAPPHDFNQQQAAYNFPRQFPKEAQPLSSMSSQSNDFLPNLTFKISNNLQSAAQMAQTAPQMAQTAPMTEASSSSFMSNRVVVVKGKSGGVQSSSDVSMSVAATPVENVGPDPYSEVGQGSSFFNSRKVLKKDNNLLNTRLVVVNNLSATITHNKLVALSRGVGEIQNLRVDTQERQATILFKSVASAHAFFKNNQRRILDDLSVIEAKLEPML